MRLVTAALFVFGLAGTAWPAVVPPGLSANSILVIGMAILGLTPIFGLAIMGASWLRRKLTDTVGWMALVLVVLTAYLWMGL